MPKSLNVLLLEPNYKNKYPPLGLMKISTFHNNKGHEVKFFKGTNKEFYEKFPKDILFDRIYISTVFTFHYKKTIETINLAKKIVKDKKNIYLGGAGATLLHDRYAYETEIIPIDGLLNKKGKLSLKDDHLVDEMIPDYDILNEINYIYPTNDAYIGYATRGCVNKCPFCAVPKLEPTFCHYKDLKKYVQMLEKKFGEKKDLLLLDNNVLASNQFKRIIRDICDLGYEYEAKDSKGRKRFVDFNQGLDSRLLNDDKAKLLSEIAIRPARIAFDHIELKDLYKENIKLMAKHDLIYLSNYLLYNYEDKPIDLYNRIKINVYLNEKYDTRIFSFPMKYIPLDYTDRSFIGKQWKKKQLRGIQAILNATHGLVGPKKNFVFTAFGKTQKDFEKLLWMPELYIMYRITKKKQDVKIWEDSYDDLSSIERRHLKQIIENNRINTDIYIQKNTPKIKSVLKHYELLLKRANMIKGQTILESF